MTVGSTSPGEIFQPKICSLHEPFTKTLHKAEQELRKKRTPHRDYRTVVMETMHRYGRISQEEIGKRCGNLDYSAVSRQRDRLREMDRCKPSMGILLGGDKKVPSCCASVPAKARINPGDVRAVFGGIS